MVTAATKKRGCKVWADDGRETPPEVKKDLVDRMMLHRWPASR